MPAKTYRSCPRCGINRQVNPDRPSPHGGLCADCVSVTRRLGELDRWGCRHERRTSSPISPHAVRLVCAACGAWTVRTERPSAHPWIAA